MINYKIEDNTLQLINYYDKPLKLKQSALEKLAEIIRHSIELNIVQGKSYDGSSLKSLSNVTINKKGSNKILIETGELLNSVTKKVNSNIAEIFISSNRSEIAQYLQQGTKYMPPRPFFGIGERVESEIEQFLTNNNINEIFDIKE